MLGDCDYGLEVQKQPIGGAVARRNFSVGFLKGNTLTPQKEVVIHPYTVETLTENHVEVRIERGLGSGADFIDLDYADSGAFIEDTPAPLFRKSTILVKLAPFTIEELSHLSENQIIVSPLDANQTSKEELFVLRQKRITALSLRLVSNVENGELLHDILHVPEGPIAASIALGDFILSLLFPLIFSDSLWNAVLCNPVLADAIYCHSGALTNRTIGQRLQIPCSDLPL